LLTHEEVKKLVLGVLAPYGYSPEQIRVDETREKVYENFFTDYWVVTLPDAKFSIDHKSVEIFGAPWLIDSLKSMYLKIGDGSI
jgi:hypothetical protein